MCVRSQEEDTKRHEEKGSLWYAREMAGIRWEMTRTRGISDKYGVKSGGRGEGRGGGLD